MVEVIKELTNGKTQTVEIDCDFFADEMVPPEWQWGHCFDEQTKTRKCSVWHECYEVYTRRTGDQF